MLGHEGIVVQMRVGSVDSVDFLGLARRKLLLHIQAVVIRQQSLSAQHLMDAGEASRELVRRIKKGRIAVGHLPSQRKEQARDGAGRACLISRR